MRGRRLPKVIAVGVLLALGMGTWYVSAAPRPRFARTGAFAAAGLDRDQHVVWVALSLQFTGTSDIVIDHVQLGPHSYGVRVVRIVGIARDDAMVVAHGGHHEFGRGDPTLSGEPLDGPLRPVEGWKVHSNADGSRADEVLIVLDVPTQSATDTGGVATEGMCVEWHHGAWAGTSFARDVELDYQPIEVLESPAPFEVPRPQRHGC